MFSFMSFTYSWNKFDITSAVLWLRAGTEPLFGVTNKSSDFKKKNERVWKSEVFIINFKRMGERRNIAS